MGDKDTENNKRNIIDSSSSFSDVVRTPKKTKDEPPFTSPTLVDTNDGSGVQATITPRNASTPIVQNPQAYAVFTHHELVISDHWILRIAEAVKQSLQYQREQMVAYALQPL